MHNIYLTIAFFYKYCNTQNKIEVLYFLLIPITYNMYLTILLLVIMSFNLEHGKISLNNNLFDKKIPHINIM